MKSKIFALLLVICSFSLHAVFDVPEFECNNLTELLFSDLENCDYTIMSEGTDFIIVEVDGIIYIVYL